MLAHLSILANLVTGLLGPVIALVIYLALKDRSRYVAEQAMQSFIFQLVWWVGGVACGWGCTCGKRHSVCFYCWAVVPAGRLSAHL